MGIIYWAHLPNLSGVRSAAWFSAAPNAQIHLGSSVTCPTGLTFSSISPKHSLEARNYEDQLMYPTPP